MVCWVWAFIGLDFKISKAPLAFSFAWRPYISFEEDGSEPVRFGLTLGMPFNNNESI